MKEVALRAAELEGTGHAHPFQIEYEALVWDPRQKEQDAHRKLKHCHERKEFFRCTASDAMAVLRETAGQDFIYEGNLPQPVPASPTESVPADPWKISQQEIDIWWRKAPSPINASAKERFGADFVELVQRMLRREARLARCKETDDDDIQTMSERLLLESLATLNGNGPDESNIYPSTKGGFVLACAADHVMRNGPVHSPILRDDLPYVSQADDAKTFGVDVVKAVCNIVVYELRSAKINKGSYATLRHYAALGARNAHYFGAA